MFITACGGGGTPASTDVPTDTSLSFSSFPPGYFGGSYSQSFSYTGSDTNGGSYTATLSVQSGADTTFNSLPVKTINELFSITNTGTNAVAGTLVNSYFSTDINSLRYYGYFTASDGVSGIATSTSVLPVSATIGSFGNVGSYTRTDGSNFSSTWSLVDGFNGKEKLILTVTSNDSSNVLDFTSKSTSLITQDGTRLNEEVVITFHQSGNLTLTLTGS